MIRFDQCWLWDSSESVYVDYTDEQRADSNISFLDDSADYMYFGLSRRPIGLYVELGTNGSYGAFTYEGYEGAWTTLSLINSYDFSSSSYGLWVLQENASSRTFSATDPHAATPPDLQADLYWIRISVASVTTQAVISKIRAIPFSTYATHKDVSRLLQRRTDFDTSTVPTPNDIEKILRRAEDRIDYITRKSWKFNIETYEEHDFNLYGIKLMHYPILKVYSAQIWNGSSYNDLDEGRTQDWFVINKTGMFQFSRYFLLPARFAYSVPGWRWSYGEFKMPIRVTYSWGRDPEKDHQFFIAQDICAKLAAIDVIQNFDFTVFPVSGTDKITYDRKIENWKQDISEKLSELQSMMAI